MALSQGQIIKERYRIVSHLAKGGFGAIYRAWDIQMEGPCAIKENFDLSPPAQRQFAREAKMLYNLRHPNLPRVFDHFMIEDQGQYLVMDFIEGDDLQTLMKQAGGPIEESKVLMWLDQVCDALIYLHSQNPPIIHRDLKPANIRINSSGQAILVDFGIAKALDPGSRTTRGAQAITHGYSPPEQYGMGATDAKSDVYALGATAYALLSGQEPPGSTDIMVKSVAPPAPVLELNPRIAPQISQTIQDAMQVDREKRLSSAAEFKAALRTVKAGVQTPAQVAPVRAAGAAVLPAQGRLVQKPLGAFKWPALLGLAAAALVGLCIVAAVVIKLAPNLSNPLAIVQNQAVPTLEQDQQPTSAPLEPTAAESEPTSAPVEGTLAPAVDGPLEYDTEFPLPPDIRNFTKRFNGQINFQTSMSIDETMDFYREILGEQGLVERTILTNITDETFSMVFDGAANGEALVIQGVLLDWDDLNVNIRYEDV